MHARNKCTLLRTANVLLSLYVRLAFFAFSGHLRFLMGIIKVSRWFGLEILIIKHP